MGMKRGDATYSEIGSSDRWAHRRPACCPRCPWRRRGGCGRSQHERQRQCGERSREVVEAIRSRPGGGQAQMVVARRAEEQSRRKDAVE